MNKLLSFAAAGAISLAAALPAQADVQTFTFTVTGAEMDGLGISADISLTYDTSMPDAKYSNGYKITGISGTFSSTVLGYSDLPILGLLQTNISTPHPTNTMAPQQFSRFVVAENTPPLNGGFLSYDNLIWPSGSPQTADDYPFSGGYFDVYGLMFRIGQGRVVNLWSNGDLGSGVTYGAHVATTDLLLGTASEVTVTAVPEPATVAMLLAGLGLVGVAARRRAAA